MKPFFTGEPTSHAMSNVSHAMLVSFEKAIFSETVLCALQYRYSPCWGVSETDHVLKHHSSRENCKCDEGQGKRTFKAFTANKVCKLFSSQSSEDLHGTDLPDAESILRSCNVCWERLSRAKLLLYPFPSRTKLCGSYQLGLVSADCFQLCTPKRFCYIRNYSPIRSRRPHVVPQYSNGK